MDILILGSSQNAERKLRQGTPSYIGVIPLVYKFVKLYKNIGLLGFAHRTVCDRARRIYYATKSIVCPSTYLAIGTSRLKIDHFVTSKEAGVRFGIQCHDPAVGEKLEFEIRLISGVLPRNWHQPGS